MFRHKTIFIKLRKMHSLQKDGTCREICFVPQNFLTRRRFKVRLGVSEYILTDSIFGMHIHIPVYIDNGVFFHSGKIIFEIILV